MAEAKFTSFVENSGSSIERMFRRAAARTAAGVPTGTPDHNHRLFDFEEAHASIRLPAIDWSGAPIAKAIFARVRTGTTTLVPSRQPAEAPFIGSKRPRNSPNAFDSRNAQRVGRRMRF